jgi:hypothetical protein
MDPQVQRRFLEKPFIISESGCWEWQSSLTADGYGWFKINNRIHRAHRTAYEVWVGPIPEGHHIRHTCDNRKCINAYHLLTGTNADNVQDRVSRNRSVRLAGQRNGRAILSELDVRDIREEYERGILTQQMLADIYGASRGNIGHIVRGLTWSIRAPETPVPTPTA